jgi:hypothetical protein
MGGRARTDFMNESSELPQNQFADQADAPSPGLFVEFIDFLKHNKKWWLIPILLVLGVVGILVILSGSVVAPFIYPLF